MQLPEQAGALRTCVPEPTTKWGAATSTFTFPLRYPLTILRIPNDMYSQSQAGWHFQNLAAADGRRCKHSKTQGRLTFAVVILNEALSSATVWSRHVP